MFVCGGKPEDSLQGLVFSFHYVSSGYGAQVTRLGGHHLYFLRHLASPEPAFCYLNGFGTSRFQSPPVCTCEIWVRGGTRRVCRCAGEMCVFCLLSLAHIDGNLFNHLSRAFQDGSDWALVFLELSLPTPRCRAPRTVESSTVFCVGSRYVCVRA